MDEDDDGLVEDPESFLTFFSFSGGESGPFSTLGEFASYKTTKVTLQCSQSILHLQDDYCLSLLEVQDNACRKVMKKLTLNNFQ